ncbi:MAG: DEAD/DEAH box helicase [Desulfovibrio sp.]
MNFSDFSFDHRIDDGIKSHGYDTPTPIQRKAIPLVKQGHDVMGLAQTGTGKTAAFALPILEKLLKSKSSYRGPQVLVLAPTRELAIQINESFQTLAQHTNIRSCVVIGGVGMNPQIKACHTAQVVVACPGRLVRIIAKKAIDLRGIDTLVLDEADRMLDMGFMPDIKRIIGRLPAKRQNLLFSATMPKSILSFAQKILVNPKTVEINATSPVTAVKHLFYKTHNSGKNALLNDLLKKGDFQSILIFTRTKHKAKRMAKKLMNSGHPCTFLQGNMSQNQREKALNGFRDGTFTIMVATDIAARGIDCDRITHVVNFDMPDTVETYTHRIGRTGRAGRSGCAITYVMQDEVSQMRAIGKVVEISIEHDSHDSSSLDEPRQPRPQNRRPRRSSARPPAKKNTRRPKRSSSGGSSGGASRTPSKASTRAPSRSPKQTRRSAK